MIAGGFLILYGRAEGGPVCYTMRARRQGERHPNYGVLLWFRDGGVATWWSADQD